MGWEVTIERGRPCKQFIIIRPLGWFRPAGIGSAFSANGKFTHRAGRTRHCPGIAGHLQCDFCVTGKRIGAGPGEERFFPGPDLGPRWPDCGLMVN